MAIVNYYVDPASTAGGTGLSEALTGTDRAFASLYEASQNISPPLTSMTNVWLKRSTSAVDTMDKDSAPHFYGFTNSSGDDYSRLNIIVHPNHRHEGKYADKRNDGNYIYRIDAEAEANYPGLYAYGNVITLDGIVMDVGTVYNSATGIYLCGGHYNHVKNCIVKIVDKGATDIVTGIEVNASSCINNKSVNNFVFTDGTISTASKGFYYQGKIGYFTGNVAANCSTGFHIYSSTLVQFYNNISINCSTSYSGTVSSSSSNNLSTDGNAPGSNSLINQNAASVLVDPTNGNPFLRTDSPAIGAGKDLTYLNSDSTVQYNTVDNPMDFTLDSVGVSRTTWDMGSLKYITYSGLPLYPTTANITVSTTATKRIRFKLIDGTGTPQSNLTGLKWAWFDEAQPRNFSAPKGKGFNGVTDSQGYIEVNLTSITSLNINDIGFFIVTNSDGTTTQTPSPKTFSGPLKIIG